MLYKCVRCGTIKEVSQPMRTCSGKCRTWYSRYLQSGNLPLEMIRVDLDVTPSNGGVTPPQNPLPDYGELINTVREIWRAVSVLETKLSQPMTFAFQGVGVVQPPARAPMPKPLELDLGNVIEVSDTKHDAFSITQNFLASLDSVDF